MGGGEGLEAEGEDPELQASRGCWRAERRGRPHGSRFRKTVWAGGWGPEYGAGGGEEVH